MQMLNSAHLSWLQCSEENDSLVIVADSCKEAGMVCNEVIHTLQQQLLLKTQALQDRDTLISTQAAVIKHREKQIVRLKWKLGGMGVLAVVEGVIISWLIIK